MNRYCIVLLVAWIYPALSGNAQDIDFYRRTTTDFSLTATLGREEFVVKVRYERPFLMDGTRQLKFQAREKGNFRLLKAEYGCLIQHVKISETTADSLTLAVHPSAIEIPPPQEIAALSASQQKQLTGILNAFVCSVVQGRAAQKKEYTRLASYQDLRSFLLALSTTLRGTVGDIPSLSMESLQRVGRYYRLSPPKNLSKEKYFEWLQQQLVGLTVEIVFTLADVPALAALARAPVVPVNPYVGKVVLHGSTDAQNRIDWWYLPQGTPQPLIETTHGEITWLSIPKGEGLYLRVLGSPAGGDYSITIVDPAGKIENGVELFESPAQPPLHFPY